MRNVGILVMSIASFAFQDSLAASIGLYGSSDCSTCSVMLPAGGSTQIYIAADGSGIPYGIEGAEFRATGLPVGWTAVSTPAPAASVAIGDPFGSGANIAFSFDQFGSCIALYSVVITANSAESEVRLRVERADPPSRPQYACPLLVANCPACTPTICVSGGEMLVNSTLGCTVATEAVSWGALKSLFR